jgi:DMSO/TMAO reductase YedYZ molybdopterin-dependent catalytic subunit
LAVQKIERLLVRADDVLKAAASRPEPGLAHEQVAVLLDRARGHLDEVADHERRRELAGAIARRVGDLDRAQLAPMLEPTPDVRRAPTTVDDPSRVPPGQRLTPGWPVLHVGTAPRIDPADWRLVVTGRVRQRTVVALEELRTLPTVTVTTDLHCVTGWSRLDNAWEGVRVRDVLTLAGPRDEASHVIVSGHPAYSANLPLASLLDDDVVLAWAHDGVPLPPAHGGPVRLVVPARYAWKSVKWVTELRLMARDVPGYWEERGYHDEADPWHEQRYRD